MVLISQNAQFLLYLVNIFKSINYVKIGKFRLLLLLFWIAIKIIFQRFDLKIYTKENTMLGLAQI